MKKPELPQIESSQCIAESSRIPKGQCYARLSYIILYTKTDNPYGFLVFETNRIRISNGQRYIIKQLINGDKFKEIFYFENYDNYLQALNKIYSIDVQYENDFPAIKSAVEWTEYDPTIHITIPQQKEEFRYKELVKFKDNGRIIFFDGSTCLLDTFRDQLEEFELNQKNNKNII
jgi:hypothetical protein